MARGKRSIGFGFLLVLLCCCWSLFAVGILGASSGTGRRTQLLVNDSSLECESESQIVTYNFLDSPIKFILWSLSRLIQRLFPCLFPPRKNLCEYQEASESASESISESVVDCHLGLVRDWALADGAGRARPSDAAGSPDQATASSDSTYYSKDTDSDSDEITDRRTWPPRETPYRRLPPVSDRYEASITDNAVCDFRKKKQKTD